MPYTYTSYLRLDELLDLQTPASGGKEHDEMLFIVIHQVYEPWFKQVLHEVDLLGRAFEESNRPLALASLKRILTIFKTLVSQVDILETMTPVSFLSFRDRLDSDADPGWYQPPKGTLAWKKDGTDYELLAPNRVVQE